MIRIFRREILIFLVCVFFVRFFPSHAVALELHTHRRVHEPVEYRVDGGGMLVSGSPRFEPLLKPSPFCSRISKLNAMVNENEKGFRIQVI